MTQTGGRVRLVEADGQSEDGQHGLVQPRHGQLVAVARVGELEHKHDVVGGDRRVRRAVGHVEQLVQRMREALAVAATRPRVEPLGRVVTSITTVVAHQWLDVVRRRRCDRQTDTMLPVIHRLATALQPLTVTTDY